MSVLDGFRVALTQGATANLSSYYVLPAGGTQPRQLQALFADRVNVKSFGAVADGSTNDTAAVQAAINYAKANGKAVWLPAGSYSVGALTWAPSVPLYGDGPLNTILVSRSASQTTLSYVATSAQNSFICSNIGFLAGTNLGKAISVRGSSSSARPSFVQIENCIFASFATAVDLYLCANTTLNNLHSILCGIGYSIDTCGDLDAVTCRAQLGSGYGFVVSDAGGFGASGEGVRLLNCTTNGQAGGLSITNQNWGQAANCSFTTCSLACLAVSGSTAWNITGCELASGSGSVAGASVNATSNTIQFSNCIIAVSSVGLSLAGTRHIVSNCVFNGNSSNDVALTATKSVVSGNNCLSTAGVNNIVESGSANLNIIGQNIIAVGVTTIGAGSISPNNVVA